MSPTRARGQVVVVDGSVWIDFLNGRNARHVWRLRAILGIDEIKIIVCDLMLCEVARFSPSPENFRIFFLPRDFRLRSIRILAR
jgi:hypothetical protein